MAKKGWIKLKNLRPGAVFETKDGTKGVKVCTAHYNGPLASSSIGLSDGEWLYTVDAGSEYVKEIPITTTVGYFWVGLLFGSMRSAKLSDEDKAKLDTLTKKFLDGIKV
jgi:hypothetical protein